MSRLSTLPAAQAHPKAQRVLAGMEQSLGFVPNMMRAMANAPAVLSGYASFSAALAGGTLSKPLREKINLQIAERNRCDYCVAAHTAIGSSAGLSSESILDARRGTAVDSADQAALDFANAVLEAKGSVSDEDLARVRAAGYDDGAITEVVASVALALFSNFFNNVAGTEIDFPAAPVLSPNAAA